MNSSSPTKDFSSPALSRTSTQASLLDHLQSTPKTSFLSRRRGDSDSAGKTAVSNGSTVPRPSSSPTGSGKIATVLPQTLHSNTQFEELTQQLDVEEKIKAGAENLLKVYDVKHKSAKPEQKQSRKQAEEALNLSNSKIANLKNLLKASPKSPSSSRRKLTGPGSRPRPATLSTPSDPPSPNPETSPKSPTWSLTELLQALEDHDRDSQWYIDRGNELCRLLGRYPGLKWELSWTAFIGRIDALLWGKGKEEVATGYRVARYSISDVQSLKHLESLRIDWHIIRSLSRPASHNAEREQALKLLRAFLDVPQGITFMTQGIVKAIVAIAEMGVQGEDRLSGIAVETLAEILVMDTALVTKSSGLRPLLQALLDGPPELSVTLLHPLLYISDFPTTRRFLYPEAPVRGPSALGVILSDLTNTLDPVKTDREDLTPITEEARLRGNAKVIAGMMSSWSGLLALTARSGGVIPEPKSPDDEIPTIPPFPGVRSLVDALRVKSTVIRDVLLDLWFEVLNIRIGSWAQNFLAGRRLTVFGRPLAYHSNNNATDNAYEPDRRTNLFSHYKSLILTVIISSGLLDALASIVESSTSDHQARKATLLLGEILQSAANILPITYCTRIQSIPRLVKVASRFSLDAHFAAISSIFQIDSLARTKYRATLTPPVTGSMTTVKVDEVGAVEAVKLKLGMQLDDAHFRQMLLDTQVLMTNNYTKWQWDKLYELFQGPLMNQKRLDESIKGIRLLPKLFGFYRPSKAKFSKIKKTKPNATYVKIGCAMFTMLLANSEGRAYLTDSKLLKEIALNLEELDPRARSQHAEPFFSKAALEDTMISGYFAMLGTLSGHKDGLAMLDHHNIFTSFYHILDLRSREDLIHLIITELDYTHDSHPRIILSKALTTCGKEIRLFATSHLGKLVDSGGSVAKWATNLLVTQLYDPSLDVCRLAVRICTTICSKVELLEYLVQLRPMLDHLGEIGAPLLLGFLATSVGFHYLTEIGYIDQEIDDWFHGRNEEFVRSLEANYERSLHFDEDDTDTSFTGVVPLHFYGELTKTAEGCRILEEKGHFDDFAHFMVSCKDEDQDLEIIVKLKSCLWAIGNIGANDGGVPFLEKSGIVKEIVFIAEQSSVISLKGTAYFVLGLISGTIEGVRILNELGWDSVLTTMGTPTGLCVPRDPSKFLSLPPIPSTPAPEPVSRNPSDLLIPFPDLDAIDTQIINTITNMISVVHAKEATRTLIKLKQRHPARFKRKFVWLGMLRCLERWNYPLAVRRFLFEFLGQRGMIRAIGRVEGTAGDSEEAEDSEDEGEDSELERKPVENAGRFDI